MAGSALIAQGIDRRRQMLRVIKAYVRRHGFAPTVQEIASEMGFSSKNAVRHHLNVLAEEDFITVEAGKHRGMQVVRKGRYPSPR